MHRTVKKVCFLLAFIVAVMTGCREKTKEEISLIQTEDQKDAEQNKDTDMEVAESIYVDVAGQVNNPDVYELPAESRIFQAIEAAGGFTEKAAVSGINQAQKLEDGQQIYVPSQKEVQAADLTTGKNQEEVVDGRVNLNTASRQELMTLTGIGEVRADAIIRYRENEGGFCSIEDLKKVEGIKDGVFEKIKDQIKI